MNKCFVMAAGLLMLLSACKKKTADVQDDVACDNTTFYLYDTNRIALMTEVRAHSTNIVKVENGVQSTVATQSGYEFWGPVLSPDRQRFICFRSTVAGNSINVNDYATAELWMFDIDGSNGHMLLSKAGRGWTQMGMADWAPDNVHIMLAAEQLESIDGGNAHWSLFVTDTLATTPIKMNTRLSHFTHPRFANGNKNLITYSALPVGVSDDTDSKCEIFYANVNDAFQITLETKITNDIQFDYSPSFSPDNNKIAYCKTTSPNSGTAVTLHVYNISTGTDHQAVNDNTVNQNPYWCPANNYIYYCNKAGTACFRDIRRMDEVGGNITDYFRTSSSEYYHISIK